MNSIVLIYVKFRREKSVAVTNLGALKILLLIEIKPWYLWLVPIPYVNCLGNVSEKFHSFLLISSLLAFKIFDNYSFLD